MHLETGQEPRTYHTRVDGSGRIVLPAELRSRQRIRSGDPVTVIEQPDGLQVKTLDQSIRDVQAYFRSIVPPGVSLVDELIAERREEAAREARE